MEQDTLVEVLFADITCISLLLGVHVIATCSRKTILPPVGSRTHTLSNSHCFGGHERSTHFSPGTLGLCFALLLGDRSMFAVDFGLYAAPRSPSQVFDNSEVTDLVQEMHQQFGLWSGSLLWTG